MARCQKTECQNAVQSHIDRCTNLSGILLKCKESKVGYVEDRIEDCYSRRSEIKRWKRCQEPYTGEQACECSVCRPGTHGSRLIAVCAACWYHRFLRRRRDVEKSSPATST